MAIIFMFNHVTIGYMLIFIVCLILIKAWRGMSNLQNVL